MEVQANHVLFCIMFFLMAFVSHSSECTYRVEVATGDRGDAGTDATVSLELCAEGKKCFLHLADLAKYGTRGPSYDYFERNNHDFFEVRTRNPCMEACKMTISHNNGGDKPGWYLDFVYVAAYEDNGHKKFQSNFEVYRWLATDERPHTLEAEVNRCPIDEVTGHLASFLLQQYGIA